MTTTSNRAARINCHGGKCGELNCDSCRPTTSISELLRDVRDNGLVYWEPNTDRGAAAKDEMLARLAEALTHSIPTAAPDDAAVERVARAICRVNTEQRCRQDPMIAPANIPEAVECQVENGWDLWIPEARAALTASIPPTTAPSDATMRMSKTLGRPFVLNDAAQGEVVQADRDFAAEIVRRGTPGLGNGNKVIADEIKGGLHDKYSIVWMARDHRLAFSHPSCEVGKVVAWLNHVGLYLAAERIEAGVHRAALSTPETVSLKGDRV